MPIQVIQHTDPLEHLVEFRISSVYEMLLSLNTLLTRHRHLEWTQEAERALGSVFMQALASIYGPMSNGLAYIELGVDAPDYDDVPSFIEYVRKMPPEEFAFYVLGRVYTLEDVRASRLEPAAMREMLPDENCDFTCDYMEGLLAWPSVAALQKHFADLLSRYWEDYFSSCIEHFQARWVSSISEKQNHLARESVMSLIEQLTGKTKLPDPLPYEQPYTEITFVPIALISAPGYLFFGYGNITVLYDSQRTEARIAEIEQIRDRSLSTLRALGDENRLRILQLIAQAAGQMSGKKIAHRLNLSPSVISRHLAQLKDGGLIHEQSADNRTITYTLEREALTRLPEHLLAYLYG
jgi:DNA-binding transcriptional ArsR family regulator